MKHTLFALSLLVSAASGTFASAEQDMSPEAQQTRIETLVAGRAAGAAFPELTEQLKHNAAKVRARLGEGMLASFDATQSEIEETCKSNLTLFKFNLAHHIYSFFLACEQNKETLDTASVATHMTYLKDQAVAEKSENDKYTFTNFLLSALRIGISPLTTVDDTTIYSLDALNKSFARKTPLCGLSLHKTGYDGLPEADAKVLLFHDISHLFFNRGYFAFQMEFIKAAYTIYGDLYDRVSMVEDAKARATDQLILFYMMHEGQNNVFDNLGAKGGYTLVDGLCPLKPDFDVLASLDMTQQRMLSHVTNANKPFSSMEKWLFESFNIPEGYSDKSAVDILSETQADKLAPVDWEPLLEDIGFSAKATYPGSPNLRDLGFTSYNRIFDIHGACLEAGIDFAIWNPDGSFNAQDMLTKITSFVDGFKTRHGDYKFSK